MTSPQRGDISIEKNGINASVHPGVGGIAILPDSDKKSLHRYLKSITVLMKGVTIKLGEFTG